MICRICNKVLSGKGKGYHIVTLHNLSYTEYVIKFRNEFPDDFPKLNNCEICNKECKGKTCSIACNGIRNGRLSKLTGRISGKNNPACNPDTAKKVSETKKRKIKDGTYTGHYYTIGHIPAAETKNKQSIHAKKRFSIPENNPMYGKTHSVESIKKIFAHRHITKPEKIIKEFLDSNNIEYTFQYFITENNICKSYDFKIKDIPLIFEIDGDYWHGGPGCDKPFYDIQNTKLNDIVKNKLAESKNIELIRFWESEINDNLEVVKSKIIESIKKYS